MQRFVKKHLAPWLLDFDSETFQTNLLRKKEINLNRLSINIATLEANVALPPMLKVERIWLSDARVKIRSLLRAGLNVINTMPFHVYVGTVSVELLVDLAFAGKGKPAAGAAATDATDDTAAEKRVTPEVAADILRGVLAGLAVEVEEINLQIRVVDSSRTDAAAGTPAGPTIRVSLNQVQWTQYLTRSGGRVGWARVGSEATTEQLPGDGTSRYTRRITLDDVRVLVDPHDEHGGMIAVPPSIRPRRLAREEPGIQIVLDAVYNRRVQKTWPISLHIEVRTAIELLLDAKGISRILVLEKKMSIASAKREQKRAAARGDASSSALASYASSSDRASVLGALRASRPEPKSLQRLPMRTRLGLALNIGFLKIEIHGTNQQGIVVEFDGDTIEGRRRAGIGIGAQMEYLPNIGWYAPTLELLCDISGCSVRLSQHCAEAGAPLIVLTRLRGRPGAAIRWRSANPLPKGVRETPSLTWSFAAPFACDEGLTFVLQDLSLQMPPRRVLPLIELFVDCTIDSSHVVYADVLFEDSRRLQTRAVVNDAMDLLCSHRFHANIGNVSVLFPLSTSSEIDAGAGAPPLPPGASPSSAADGGDEDAASTRELRNSVILYLQLGSATLRNRWQPMHKQPPPDERSGSGSGSGESSSHSCSAFLSQATALSASFPLVYTKLVSAKADAAASEEKSQLNWPSQLRLNIEGLSIEASRPGSSDAARARVGLIEAALSLAHCSGRRIARADRAVLLTMGAVLGDLSGNGSAPNLLATCYEQVSGWVTEAVRTVTEERQGRGEAPNPSAGKVRPRSGSVLEWPSLDSCAMVKSTAEAVVAPASEVSSVDAPPLKFLMFLRLGPGTMQTWSGTKPNGITTGSWWPMQLPSVVLSPSDILFHNFHGQAESDLDDEAAQPSESEGSRRLYLFQQLDRFYMKYAPDNRDKIGNILTTYAGREEELFANLKAKYGVSPVPEVASAETFPSGGGVAPALALTLVVEDAELIDAYKPLVQDDALGVLLISKAAGKETPAATEIASHLNLDIDDAFIVALCLNEMLYLVKDAAAGNNDASIPLHADFTAVREEGDVGESPLGAVSAGDSCDRAPPAALPALPTRRGSGRGSGMLKKANLQERIGKGKVSLQARKLKLLGAARNLKGNLKSLGRKSRRKSRDSTMSPLDAVMMEGQGGGGRSSSNSSSSFASTRDRANELKQKLGAKVLAAGVKISSASADLSFEIRERKNKNRRRGGGPKVGAGGFSDEEEDGEEEEEKKRKDAEEVLAAAKKRKLADEQVQARYRFRYGVDGLEVDPSILSWLAEVDDRNARLLGLETGGGIAWRKPKANFGSVFEAFATLQGSLGGLGPEVGDEMQEHSFALLQRLQEMQSILQEEQNTKKAMSVELIHRSALLMSDRAVEVAVAAVAASAVVVEELNQGGTFFERSGGGFEKELNVIEAVALCVEGRAAWGAETVKAAPSSDALASCFDSGANVGEAKLYRIDDDGKGDGTWLIGGIEKELLYGMQMLAGEEEEERDLFVSTAREILRATAKARVVEKEVMVEVEKKLEQLKEEEVLEVATVSGGSLSAFLEDEEEIGEGSPNEEEEEEKKKKGRQTAGGETAPLPTPPALPRRPSMSSKCSPEVG